MAASLPPVAALWPHSCPACHRITSPILSINIFSVIFWTPVETVFFQDLVTYPQACLLQPHVPLTSGYPLITNYLVSEGDLFTLVILRSNTGSLKMLPKKPAMSQSKYILDWVSAESPLGGWGLGQAGPSVGRRLGSDWVKVSRLVDIARQRGLRSLFMESIESLGFTFFPIKFLKWTIKLSATFSV